MPVSVTPGVQLIGLEAATTFVRLWVTTAQGRADERQHAECTGTHLLLTLLDVPEVVVAAERVGSSGASMRRDCEQTLLKMSVSRGKTAFLAVPLIVAIRRANSAAPVAQNFGFREMLGALPLAVAPPVSGVLEQLEKARVELVELLDGPSLADQVLTLAGYSRVAQRVVVEAQDLATKLGHAEVAPLHVMATLLADDQVRAGLVEGGGDVDRATKVCGRMLVGRGKSRSTIVGLDFLMFLGRLERRGKPVRLEAVMGVLFAEPSLAGVLEALRGTASHGGQRDSHEH